MLGDCLAWGDAGPGSHERDGGKITNSAVRETLHLVAGAFSNPVSTGASAGRPTNTGRAHDGKKRPPRTPLNGRRRRS